MKYKFAAVTLVATALAVAPLAPAHADWHHGGYGHGGYGGHEHHGDGGLILGLGAAVVGATVALATLPFHAVEAVAAPEPYYATPAYYPQPAPAYYGYAPAYQPRRVVYAYPQPYAYPAYYAYPQ